MTPRRVTAQAAYRKAVAKAWEAYDRAGVARVKAIAKAQAKRDARLKRS